MMVVGGERADRTEADDDSPSRVVLRPGLVRRPTPAPMVSPHVYALIQAAYAAGWRDRAYVEQAVRLGEIESPEREPEPATGEDACLLCGTPMRPPSEG